MKKVRFLVLALSILSVSRIQAQGFHLGIKAGANLASLNGRSFDNGFNWGFMAGGFAELNVTPNWGIQPEVLFSSTKTQTASDFSTIVNEAGNVGINNQSVSLNYLSIPILLSFKPVPILSIQVGPQFGILMNTSQNITSNGKNAFKSGDFSIVGGAQLNLGGFKGGARYIFGLSNIDDVTNVDTWNNRTIQFYIGFRIF
jgi:Outer membrane protein beta-barrel domain